MSAHEWERLNASTPEGVAEIVAEYMGSDATPDDARRMIELLEERDYLHRRGTAAEIVEMRVLPTAEWETLVALAVISPREVQG